MKFSVKSTYTTYTRVLFDNEFDCELGGTTMDDAMEIVTKMMLNHNFTHADVIDAETGEVLLVIDAEVDP